VKLNNQHRFAFGTSKIWLTNAGASVRFRTLGSEFLIPGREEGPSWSRSRHVRHRRMGFEFGPRPPRYRCRAVDILLTNFHLRRSTLFMPVSAFCRLGKMKQVYAHAIESGYRSCSYVDACLLFRNKEPSGGQRRTCAVPTIYRHRDRRWWARFRFAHPTKSNLIAVSVRSARLARFVAFPALGGLGGAFVDAVTLALVKIVPRAGHRADQNQPEQISPTSFRHRQPLRSPHRDDFGRLGRIG
jgi:hypothetical protein